MLPNNFASSETNDVIEMVLITHNEYRLRSKMRKLVEIDGGEQGKRRFVRAFISLWSLSRITGFIQLNGCVPVREYANMSLAMAMDVCVLEYMSAMN